VSHVTTISNENVSALSYHSSLPNYAQFNVTDLKMRKFWRVLLKAKWPLYIPDRCQPYCNGVRRSSQPPTPLHRKGIRSHHFGNYYDVFH